MSIPNLHDVAAVPGGTVPLRSGVLFRSADLAGTNGSSATVSDLGVRTVVDLRTEPERRARPDVVPDSVRTVIADVLADHRSAPPAAARTTFDDPVAAARRVRADDVERHMLDTYESFVTMPSARQAYATLFRQVAAADGTPLLFHCAVGKDRTGWATAVLHQLAGLDHEQVLAAYLSVREPVFTLLKPLIERFEHAGGRPDDIHPMIDARRAYLDTAIASMTAHYGDVHGYLSRGLGLDDATIDAVRAVMVE